MTEEELLDIETVASRSEVGWCIANINSLNLVLGNLNSSVCEDSGCVQFTEEPNKKHGFSLSLQLHCQGSHCLLEICVNRRETLRILRQWHEKCVLYNLELTNKAKMMK